jgi:hypothetical protein
MPHIHTHLTCLTYTRTYVYTPHMPHIHTFAHSMRIHTHKCTHLISLTYTHTSHVSHTHARTCTHLTCLTYTQSHTTYMYTPYRPHVHTHTSHASVTGPGAAGSTRGAPLAPTCNLHGVDTHRQVQMNIIVARLLLVHAFMVDMTVSRCVLISVWLD